LKLKLDLHVHTSRSTDAFTPPEQLRTICRERGLDGLAITDHNVLAQDLDDELVILPGIEISSRDGHIIGLGLSDAIPRGLSADETIRKIREQTGVSIIPHPYDLFRSSVRPHLFTVRPDAIFVINSSSCHRIVFTLCEFSCALPCHGMEETGRVDDLDRIRTNSQKMRSHAGPE